MLDSSNPIQSVAYLVEENKKKQVMCRSLNITWVALRYQYHRYGYSATVIADYNAHKSEYYQPVFIVPFTCDQTLTSCHNYKNSRLQ